MDVSNPSEGKHRRRLGRRQFSIAHLMKLVFFAAVACWLATVLIAALFVFLGMSVMAIVAFGPAILYLFLIRRVMATRQSDAARFSEDLMLWLGLIGCLVMGIIFLSNL